eukprot:gene7021-9592_t
MRASENLLSTESTLLEVADIKEATVDELTNFQAVRSSTNYIIHYVSHHRDFSSLIIVVLWKKFLALQYVMMVCLCYMSIKRAQQKKLLKLGATSDWDAIRVKQVIAQHQKRLFIQHANLVAIRPSDHVNGLFFIEFVVLCKRFVPITDKEYLPRHLENIPTRVCSGWIELCGRREQSFHRPLLPGAGFAAGETAELQLNVLEENYVPPVLGTLGGYYFANGIQYGVTCAHCIKKSGSEEMHLKDTPVFQPSAMGLILTAASIDPAYIGAYENLKSNIGYHGAMKWLIKELEDIPNFATELPPYAQCGVIYGGLLGPLENDGPVVDVALVKLSVDGVSSQCATSPKFPALQSPSLTLGETAAKILEVEIFPQNIFAVYGRGAQSIDTMKALVNPIQSDIYFRTVEPGGLGALVFKCIQAAPTAPADTTKNWQPGDSGTWCWTEDGFLVGMGMAYAHIGGKDYCCMMPMSHVVSAIEQLTR